MITDKIIDQILAIRDTGKYNMFDIQSIQMEAYDKGYFELMIFLEDELKTYSEFIMTGKQ